MRHIRHYRQPSHILKRKIVKPRPRSRAERPNDVFEIVHIDVVSDEKDAVDEHRGFGGEDQVPDLAAEGFGVGFQEGELR